MMYRVRKALVWLANHLINSVGFKRGDPIQATLFLGEKRHGHS